MDLRYFSAFSGIGGFELGIGKQGTCIGYSEIDKYALDVYKKHFPTHRNFGDITTIDTGKIPDFDLFVGGFPCQAFSIAGKRKGFTDTRGTLFFDIARIIKDKRPNSFLLENVKGLLNHDKGKTFSIIIHTLRSLGYRVEWMVLNSQFFGVPQRRERTFIIGHLGKESTQKILSFKDRSKANNETSKGFDGVNTLTAMGYSKIGGQDDYISGKQTLRKVVNSIDANYFKSIDNHGQRTFVKESDVSARKLTPLECERLQGFPDNWTTGLSDTQRYKTLGNAVTVPVVKSLVGKFLIYK